jgi:hypothetical protein
MTLEMFFAEDFKPWSDSHVQAIRNAWAKMPKSHKLFEFNREWYTGYFEKMGPKGLAYIVSLEIPNFSDWANDVKKARDATNLFGGYIT